jgi:hypothetical protein
VRANLLSGRGQNCQPCLETSGRCLGRPDRAGLTDFSASGALPGAFIYTACPPDGRGPEVATLTSDCSKGVARAQ